MSTSLKDKIALIVERFISTGEFYSRLEAVKALGNLARPQSAGALLKIALDRNENSEIRIGAVNALARTGSPESLAEIIPLISDPSTDIKLAVIPIIGELGVKAAAGDIIRLIDKRGNSAAQGGYMEWDPKWDIEPEAVKALGKIGDPLAVGPIIGMYEREISYDQSEYVFQALGEIGSDEAIEYLKKKLKKGTPQEKRLVLKVISQTSPLLKKIETQVAKAVQDKNPDVRAAACAVVTALDTDKARDHLRLAFDDPDETCRAAAIKALGDVEADGMEAVVAKALADGAEIVRVEGARLAGNYSFETFGPKLVHLMDHDSDEVSLAALKSLLVVKPDHGAKILSDMIKSKGSSPYFRIQSVYLLQKYYPDLAPSLLPSPLAIEPRQVSCAVADCIVQCGGEKDIENLLDELGDLTGRYTDGEPKEPLPDADEEHETSVMIGKKSRLIAPSPGAAPGTLKAEDLIRIVGPAGKSKAVSILTKLLASPKSTLAEAAARSLAQMGDGQTRPALLKALGHRSSHVRSEAAQALGDMGVTNDEEIAIIGELITSDPDDLVREKAAYASGSERSQTALPYLIKGLGDSETGVRKECVIALGKLGGQEAIKPLIDSLFNHAEFTHLREDVCAALKRLDLTVVKEGLLDVLNSKDRVDDHWVAIQSLGAIYS